jgi:hypothetical protein
MLLMNRLAILFCLSVLVAPQILAQSKKTPTFAQYGVSVRTARAKPPNLKSHKDARLFRTNLRNAAKNGINFAGHYALTYWGCGSSCGVGAIVDLHDGTVFFPKQLNGVWAQEWPDSKMIPFGFCKNSRLLILYGYLPDDYNGDRVKYGYHYFVWNGSRLKHVKFVAKDWRAGE